MTIGKFSPYPYPLSSSGSSAPTAFMQMPAPTASAKASPLDRDSDDKPTQSSSVSQASSQAAQAKLAATDPQLAQKLDSFHQQIDQLVQSGATDATVAKTVKADVASLSSDEKSKIQSVFGSGRPHHHHGVAPSSSSNDNPPPDTAITDPKVLGRPNGTPPRSPFTQIMDNFLQNQGTTAYAQSKSQLAASQTEQMLALAA